MTREVNKKESLFAVSVAGGFAALLAFMVFSFFGVSKPSEEINIFLLLAFSNGYMLDMAKKIDQCWKQ